MFLNNLVQYRVTECDDCIVIGPSNITVKMPGANPLVIAPAGAVAEYLSRYFHARERGKDLKAAHAEALIGAKVIAPKGDVH